MTFSLIVETGTARTDANAYCSVGYASAYHSRHAYPSTWNSASTGAKNAAIAMATRLLDDYMNWYGRKRTDTQALEWPRYEMYDRAGYIISAESIPNDLKDACAELARWLLAKDRTAETGDRGFSSLKLGDLGLDVNPVDRTPVIPSVVISMIDYLATQKGAGSLRLIRT